MTPIVTLGLEICVVIVYVILLVFTIIGGILYTHAYINMKQSKIIGSIATLFFLISLDSLWWLLTTVNELGTEYPIKTFTHPIALIIIKGLLTYGIILFIIRSLRDESIADPISDMRQERLF